VIFSLFIGVAASQIAIVHGESSSIYYQDVAKKLSKYFNVSIVTAKTSTPSFSTLTQYSAVIAWPDGGFSDAVALGTVFKRYVDAGYGLVMCMFGFDNVTSNDALRGTWNNNYWALIPQNTYLTNGPFTLVPLISSHPILNGVNSLNGGTSSFRGGAWNSAAQQVAQWSDGTPLVGVITVGSSVRVDLSLYPPSSDAGSGYWVSSTDGARLMANAIAYTIGSSCSQFSRCSNCTYGGCQWCLDTNTCSSPSTSCPDRIVNPSDCPVDCGHSKCSTCLDPSRAGQCSWCLDTHSCVPASESNNCKGDINDIKYCPSISFI